MPITKDTPGVEIELFCEPDDTQIEGNASAVDPETDAETNAWIRDQLNRGNEWAWCVAHVRVTFNGLTADDYLGAVSCRDEKEFRAEFMPDMVSTCIDDINAQITKLNTASGPPDESWKVIPGTAGTPDMEEHRRYNGILSLYVGAAGKRGPGGKYRPGFDHRWTIWSYGTLLGEGFTDDKRAARSACEQEADRVEWRIREAIKAMDVRGPTETL